MKARIELLPEAKIELADALRWYAAKDPAVARRLNSAVREALATLRKMPKSGIPLEADFRGVVLNRFSHIIIYKLRGSTIRVYSITHTRRKPGPWFPSSEGEQT